MARLSFHASFRAAKWTLYQTGKKNKLTGVYKVSIVGTMKMNQSTIKVYDSTRNILGGLSQTYGISMCAIVDALAHKAKADPNFRLEIPPKDKRYKSANARRVVKKET